MALYIRLKHVNTSPRGTIERIEMEKYIKGVVNAELGGSDQPEALKAQAIAARTYAARYIGSKGDYDLDDTTKYQAYKPEGMPIIVSNAVVNTEGIVVTYNDKLATTVYSASNGGRVRSSKEVWGGDTPYLVSKTDGYTSRSGYSKYGHGVGMSQRGAIQAAREGLSYQEILNFYYPGTTLKNNYNGVNSTTATPTSSTPIDNKGNKVVEEAMKHLDKSYVHGASGPVGFDHSGLVYYVYKTAINYNWSRMSAYDMYQKEGRLVSGNLCAGDLIFFKDTLELGKVYNPNITHVGIATGNGYEFIHASVNDGSVIISSLDDEYWKEHQYAVKRILKDSETSYAMTNYVNATSSLSPTDVEALVSGLVYSEDSDRYLNTMLDVQNTITALNENEKGWKYGYLVDLTNGGEFKFIVPEFDTSITANWEPVSIIGRSAEVRGYNNTSARNINLSLELVAGAGLYVSDKGGVDIVDLMHKDIEFVQSLQYPDYSKAIVFPPSTVYLYLNELIQIRGVVETVNVSYKKPYDNLNRPMMATLSFTVVQVSDNPPDYSDIRNRKPNIY